MQRLTASIAALALFAPSAHAARLPATPATIAKVLSRARGGDTLLLAPGLYAALVLKGRTFAPRLTITSSDPAQPATLADVNMMGVQGLTFRQLEIVTTGRGWASLAQKSKGITYDHVAVHGSLDNDAGNDGGGLGFLNTSDVTVTNSDFTQLRQGASFGANPTPIANITVAGNNIHGVMKSGLVFAGASQVTIACNRISDIRVVPPQHPDAIQFFTTGTTTAAHDINISDNVILRGDGQATQGIFLRDQVGALPYERVVIANNLIVGTGYGGIYVMGAKGLQVTGNELVSRPGKENATWILIQGAEDVRSEGNRAVRISYDKVSNLSEQDNVEVKPVNDEGAAAVARRKAMHPKACSAPPGP